MNALLAKRGITVKISLVLAGFLSLILTIALTGYYSLYLSIEADRSILKSMDIQNMVLEMDRGLEKARRLNNAFFIYYPSIGLEKSHQQYAQPSIREISHVIAISERLKETVNTSPVDFLLKKDNIDLTLYLSLAERFAKTSIRSYELVTDLVGPKEGLETEMKRILDQLGTTVTKNPQLNSRYETISHYVTDYRISKQRYIMQSAFNEAILLLETSTRSNPKNSSETLKIQDLIDRFFDIGNRILTTNGEIKKLLKDFSLQAETASTSSSFLINLARDQVALDKLRITRSHKTATIIIILISLTGFGAAILLSWTANRTVTRKILQLNRITGEFNRGNLDLSVPVDSHDELGELAATFNHMAIRIKNLVDNLEENVRQRTFELETTNRDLEHQIRERINAEKENEILETQLRQAYKMEAIGTLAGGIAHDFNNILAAIMGYAEMISDDLPKSSLSHSYIEEVITAGTRAKELVGQILAFSRKSHRKLAPVHLNTVMDEALILLRASIPATIEIRKDYQDNLFALSDDTQIHQIAINLCNNAAHAMETTGGILTVRLFEEIVDEGESRLKAGPYAVISVSDTGCGIEQENIDRIFDPYFTTKEVGKGSGMGLSVVHGIVKSNEGVIRVESTPGEGSTFTVLLPSAGSQPPQKKRNSRPTVPGGHEHILVVDDEPTLSIMTRKRLEKLGYRVTVFNSSLDALSLFREEKERIDLVITDQTMPQMTGETMAGEFLAIRPDIPIILTSGYSAVVDEEKAIQSGIMAFLMKPVSQNELAVTIRKILDKRPGAGRNGTTATGE